ncbi:enoyl-CoA hydratase [Plasticicumulans lactativorans]|uniref:enoyl-CoA hydratase n=1 Tax=Plasticicumulans lactativorans TaxID=1133106 RepID=A0A4R2L2F2_9GAMM|nr:enoyl-CoA hydratase-related protein [Plasticicumulans lactativorans]TCO81264.1 enoyl-CoA hydratase [Plasticicumulans lactativorans]
MAYETLLVDVRPGGVGLITLNRPQALNALSAQLVRELGAALLALEADADVGAIVITGGTRVFAAGADIKDMEGKAYVDLFLADFPHVRGDVWTALDVVRKPVIAAVAGFALGGGCELAMACDFILAADTAKFGQPEIAIGTLPGAGGTQRLTRLVGKSKAMEMCLTGRTMDAREAERSGLVSRVVVPELLIEEAVSTATKIAALSRPVVWAVKEAVNVAYEGSLAEGRRFERRAFEATFALQDCVEGMQAFVDKRKPVFRHR